MAHFSGMSFIAIVMMKNCNCMRAGSYHETVLDITQSGSSMKVAHTVSVVLTLFEVPGPSWAPSESKLPPKSLLTLLLVALGAFTPALEAMNS